MGSNYGGTPPVNIVHTQENKGGRVTEEAEASEGKKSRRLSGEPAIHLDHFPLLAKFDPPDMLPTYGSVLGVMRSLCGGGKNQMSNGDAAVETAKLVMCKYYHDTIYCHSQSTITKHLKDVWRIYKEGGRYARAGRMNLKVAQEFEELIKKRDTLFDMSTDDPTRKKLLEMEWGVKMGMKEKLYLDDQRGPRLMACDSGVDPTFYRVFMAQQRQREREEEYRERREEEFRGKSIEQIEQYLRDQGEILTTSPESSQQSAGSWSQALDTPFKRKRLLEPGEPLPGEPLPGDTLPGDPLPPEFRHIRESERKVKDSFYLTCADLAADGLSLMESMKSVCIIGNGMFGRSWILPEERSWSDVKTRLDTLPEKTHVLQKLRLIEAERLSLVVEKMREEKEKGHMITHASDSTTKKRVGQFIGQVG